MRHINTIKTLSFLFSLWFSLWAFSATSVQAAEKLNGCFVVWPPYTQVVEGKPFGITVDVMYEAARRANFDLTLTSLPWKRCMKLVQRGEFSFAMDALKRDGFISGNFPSALYIQTFWHRDTEDYGNLLFIGSLLEKRLALMQGYDYPEEILNAGFQHIEWVKTESIAARLIVNDRLDLVYADTIVMQYLIKKRGFRLKPMTPVYSVQPLFPMFNIGRLEIKKRIDKALSNMHKDGGIDKIYKKHTGLNFSEFVAMGKSLKPSNPEELNN